MDQVTGAAPARISLVLPNRNHADYLPLSIGGLLRQTRPAAEIIIFDDQSTDDSLRIITEFQKRDPRIRLIARDKNAGVVANLNEGLALATGGYIAFPGADDLTEPDFLECLGAMLDAHPDIAFAASCAAVWDSQGRVTGQRPIIWPRSDAGILSPAEYRVLLRRSDNHFLGAVTLYRRQMLCDIGGFDPLLGPMCDGVAARRLAARHGFGFVPAILGAWRNHGGSYSINAATNPAVVNRLIDRLNQVISAEPPGLFDPNYADRLARRLQFGGIRLIALRGGAAVAEAEDQLAGLGLDGALDRLVTRASGRLGRWGAVALTAWAFLRFWPMSVLDLLRQRFRRARPARR